MSSRLIKKIFRVIRTNPDTPSQTPYFTGQNRIQPPRKRLRTFSSFFFDTLRRRAHHRPSTPKMAYCTAYEGREEIPIHRPFQRLALLVGEYIRQLFFDLQNPFCTDNHSEIVRDPKQWSARRCFGFHVPNGDNLHFSHDGMKHHDINHSK